MEAVALVLAAYYLTAAVTRTDGPWGAFYRLRRIRSLPFHCATCTALYAALLCWGLGALNAWPAVYVLAIAGAVTAIEDIRQSLLK